jgi:hypothetical protein
MNLCSIILAKFCNFSGRWGVSWATGGKTMRLQSVLTAGVVILVSCGRSGGAPAWAGHREVIDSVEVVWNPAEPMVAVPATLTALWHTQPPETNPDSLWERPSEVRAASHGVYVLDDLAAHVYRLDPATGSWIGTIGKKGGGPGEIDQLFGIALRDSTVVIGDGGKRAVSVFALDGRFLRTHPIEGFGMDVQPYGADDVAITVMVPTGQTIGSEYRIVGQSAPGNVITFAGPLVTPDEYPDQDCLRTDKTTRLILRLRCIMPWFLVLDEQGSLLRQVVVDQPPTEIPVEDIDRIMQERFSRVAQSLNVPEIPVEMRDRLRAGMRYESRYRAIRHDAESRTFLLWEQTPDDRGSGPALVHVFSEDGRYLAQAEASVSWGDFDVRNGVVYALVPDPETDLRSAAAYRLTLPGGASGME